MNANQTTVRIESIIFDNTDTKVLIKGETFKNHLSYASELFINFNDLNRVINHLQLLNPGVNVSEMLQEEFLGNGYYQTILNGNQLENNLMDLAFLSLGGTKKLIRA